MLLCSQEQMHQYNCSLPHHQRLAVTIQKCAINIEEDLPCKIECFVRHCKVREAPFKKVKQSIWALPK